MLHHEYSIVDNTSATSGPPPVIPGVRDNSLFALKGGHIVMRGVYPMYMYVIHYYTHIAMYAYLLYYVCIAVVLPTNTTAVECYCNKLLGVT